MGTQRELRQIAHGAMLALKREKTFLKLEETMSLLPSQIDLQAEKWALFP